MKLQALCLHPDLHVQQGMDGTLKVWKVDGCLDGDLAVILETPTNKLDPPAPASTSRAFRGNGALSLQAESSDARHELLRVFGISLTHTEHTWNIFWNPLMPYFYPCPNGGRDNQYLKSRTVMFLKGREAADLGHEVWSNEPHLGGEKGVKGGVPSRRMRTPQDSFWRIRVLWPPARHYLYSRPWWYHSSLEAPGGVIHLGPLPRGTEFFFYFKTLPLPNRLQTLP